MLTVVAIMLHLRPVGCVDGEDAKVLAVSLQVVLPLVFLQQQLLLLLPLFFLPFVYIAIADAAAAAPRRGCCCSCCC